MKIIATTDRIILREFSEQDAVGFYELNLNPKVLKYTGDVPFNSIQDAKEFIQNYNAYQLYGIGRWAIIHTKTQEFLGFCGLKFHPEEKITEIGFRLHQKYWGLGYATEAAKATLLYGFKTKKLPIIYAHTAIPNIRSQKVLKKLGFTKVKTFDYGGIPAFLFELKNPYLINDA